MFICGFDDIVPNQHIIHLIQQYSLGGIIYFKRNVKDVSQIRRLSDSLQKIANESSEIPLLISIDQEGGMVARIDKEITLIPGNMALGAARDTDGTYQAAKISGKELRLLGINMNFAPSIDINNNPLNPVIGVRSYGEVPELVNELGRATIRGLQEAGVSATAKHFPGHGDTDMDSHHDLPIIKHDLERLKEIELLPFRGAIEEGVDAIMTAHILFPAIDSSHTPATLSHKVLSGLLRKQLGYSGVIVTDCLEMSAISKSFGTTEGAILAVEAGADLLLVSHTYEKQIEAIQALIEAVESGRISETRINESVERILNLKKKRKMDEWKMLDISGEVKIGTEEDKRVIVALSEKSITLVKDHSQLPLQQKKTYVIWTENRTSSGVDEVIEQSETLGKILNEFIHFVEEDRISVFPSNNEINHVIHKSKEFDQVIFVTYNATFSEGQTNMVKEIAKRENTRLIVVAARNPYDLLQFPEVKTYITCYENRPLAMKSLAKVLVGKNHAQGRLPISISHEFPFE